MTESIAEGARIFGGKGRSVYQRVEDNAFHLTSFSFHPCHLCNPRFLRSSTFVPIRVHSWLARRKFSLNSVEGISTSDLNVQPSTAESARATTNYADRTDAQTQKE